MHIRTLAATCLAASLALGANAQQGPTRAAQDCAPCVTK